MRIITCASCGRSRPHAARGWCITCYMRWRRQHQPQEDRRTITCTACGETGPAAAHDWCQNCYQRWNRNGRPESGPPPRKPLQPCGTDAGYQRHVKYGEPIDDACRQAHNDDQNERRAKARAGSSVRKQWTDEQAHAAHTVALATEGSSAERLLLLEALGLVPAAEPTAAVSPATAPAA